MSASLTRTRVEKIRGTVTRLKEQGHADEAIVRLMQENLPDLDERNVRQLLDWINDDRSADDFAKADLVRVTDQGRGRLHVTVQKPIEEIHEGRLVRFQSQDWVVLRVLDSTYELKSF